MASRQTQKFLSLLLPMILVALAGAMNTAQALLTFSFDSAVGTPPEVIAGFKAAGDRWSAIFTDPVTIVIKISFPDLPGEQLGATSQPAGTLQLYSYSTLRGALEADKSSAADTHKVGLLQPGSSFNMLINKTANNPNGSGSATTYLDNGTLAGTNNTQLLVTNANARALGLPLTGSPGFDASVQNG